MNTPHDDRFENLIDEAARSVREDALGEAEVAAAARRVADALSAEAAAGNAEPAGRAGHALLGCTEIQALLPARHDGTLVRDRALLVDEHLKGCVTCRAAYKRVRTGAPAVTDRLRRVPAAAPGRRPWAWAWAAAAAVVIAAVGGAWLLQPGWFSLGANTATVAELDGLLLNVGRVSAMPIARGAKVAYGETMRTGKDAGAVVVLADGSRIELAPRTEMTLARAADGTDIRLGGGQVIVEASKQGSGHLYVTTADSRVAVKGTVFSVLSGAKGTRVSVLEGAVEVDHGSERAMLKPGDQFTSSPTLSGTTLEDEIGWSRNADRHRALLAELTALSRAIDALPGPSPRTSTRLMDLMPADAVLFAALPNLSGRIDEAWRLFLERAHANETLGAWWREHTGPEQEAQLAAVVEKVRLVGGELGEEIALAGLAGNTERPISGLAVVATLKDEASFRALVETEMAGLARTGDVAFRLVSSPDDVPSEVQTDGSPARPALYVMTRGDLMLAATGRSALEALAGAVATGQGGFAGTPLRAELAAAYRDGAVWLGGVDVATLIARSAGRDESGAPRAEAQQAFALTGLAGAKFLVVEGDGEGEASTLHATMVFDGPRRGALAWLAEPSPMGALRFVSPDATLAVAAVVKDPVEMLDESYALLGERSAEVKDTLGRLGTELGLDVRSDLLAPLGGEFVFALDGPVLPTPAWKVAAEVYDPQRLQRTIELIVARAAARATEQQKPVPVLTSAEEGGRTFYQVASQPPTLEVHYTFADGYVIIASQRTLLAQALANARAGITLAASPAFVSRLPRDGHANVSGLVWRDTGRLLDAFSSLPMPDGTKAVLGALEGGPMLDVAYGETDRITVAGARRSLTRMLLPALLGGPGPAVSPEPLPEGESAAR